MRKILVIDDEKSVQESLRILFSNKYKVFTCGSGKEGLDVISTRDIDIVFLDILMPDIDGINVLREIKKNNENIIVIMLTAISDISTAVDAMKLGAYDYITKPFEIEEIRILVDKICQDLKIRQNIEILSDEIEKTSGTIIFKSQLMENIINLARKAAPHDSSILITGQTGTGKELLARFIHKESQRKQEAFIPIHCAAIPETLFESEVFGYEKGAFTGAFKSKPGKIEIAGSGTIFFDEIGEMPISLQTKLLRVLQEHEFSRIGSNESIKMEARVLAATSKDLKNEIKSGRFREDLFYRLSVIPIEIPPLKDRKDDILMIAYHFLANFAVQMGIKTKFFSPSAEKCLLAYDWPGNIRELKNVVERILVLKGNKDIINIYDLPEDIRSSGMPGVSENGSFIDKVIAFERQLIIDAMEKSGWNRSKAAQYLKISRRMLSYKIEKYEIRKDKQQSIDC